MHKLTVGRFMRTKRFCHVGMQVCYFKMKFHNFKVESVIAARVASDINIQETMKSKTSKRLLDGSH